MKRRHFIIINIIFFGLMFLSFATVYQFMTGRQPLNALAFWTHKQQTYSTNTCQNKSAIAKLDESDDDQLKKLAVFQKACHSYVTGTMMTFIGMPTNADEATSQAQKDADKLKAFSKYGVRPLVIAEPTDSASNNIDFAAIAGGQIDPALDVYFAKLKELGLTDQQLGIWNPLPEANLPYWKNNQPEYFAPGVNHYLTIARKYFPALSTSIMLNSASYEATDFNWENGDYTSWLPYIKGIQPGLVSYVGMQGFPWSAAQGGTATIFNAADFLNPKLLVEAADYLKVKNVWYNTGTYSTKYSLDPARIVYSSPEQRKEIMDTIQTQARWLQNKDYTVAINLFSLDKSKTPEETNWSYWANDPFHSASTPVFTGFAGDLAKAKIDLWLFDN